MLPRTMILVSWSKTTSMMNSAWKIGVNSHASEADRVRAGRRRASSGACESATAWRPRAGARRAAGAGDARGDEQREDDEQQERREPTGSRGGRRVTRCGARRVSGPGHSRPGSTGGSGRCAAAPIQLPSQQPVLLDRLLGVARAGRLVAAAGRQPGEHDAVEPDQPIPIRPMRFTCPPDLRARRPERRIRRSAPTSVSWSASTIAGRAMMRTSQPGWNEGAITLSASRSRRRTRLRTTAPPSARPVDSPNRVVSRSVRRNRAVEERVGPGGPASPERREVLRAGEHHEPRRVRAAPDGQAVSRFRPRARRAARTRRPPAVFIRARKPCSLARWRFLG